MEVKLGYKRTEVGVIPEEWELRKLPEVSWFQEGPGLRNWQFTSTGMKVINVTNLENGVLNLERTDRYISNEEFNRMYRHFAVDAADIVMASSGNSYSKTAVVRHQDLPLVMNTSVIRFKPSNGCDYGYLWSFLNSPLFKKQVDLMITGGAQPNFGPYHLKRVIVPVPPPPEQRAIAEALGNMDALLGALEKLIAKKRDLKQAAMQQLLTGQKRLPGFLGEWEVVIAGEIGKFRGGNGFPLKWQSSGIGTYPFFKVSDMNNDGNETFMSSANNRISEETRKELGATAFPAGSVVFAKVGAAIFLERKKVLFQLSCIDNNMAAFTLNTRRADVRFIHMWLLTIKLGSLVATTALPSLSGKQLREISLRLPPLTEQTAIASVLSDMDAELAVLEQRRDKTRALKQGMMQELLTGRIRLV